MERERLLAQLDAYAAMYPEELAMVGEFRAFVAAHADCFERSCAPGHVTASAWILSPDGRRFLLTHHRKLGKWLQLGGHADGEAETHVVAMREAFEESGIKDFGLLATDDELVPLDVDVHVIPARPGEPEHKHYDVRWLLVAQAEQLTRNETESNELRWVPMAELEAFCQEESLRRMGEKVRAILAHMAHPS
jgi:8-oxo-dGTP pyrophosphatase MutT (NUDIX family)